MKLITHHYDDSNKEVGEYKVAQEEECNGEELTTLEPMGTQLVL